MTGEFGRIARYFRPLAADLPGAFALTDDAAVLSVPPGQEVVVTTDTLVEGVHFLPRTPASDLAWKALAVNVSDLAAMAADPFVYTVALATRPEIDDAWIAGFAGGLAAAQAAFGLVLAGGDSVGMPGPLSVTITAQGLVPAGAALRRAGARPGDVVFVSGEVGAGALGLLAARGELAGFAPAVVAALSERYLRPAPRTALTPVLRGRATAGLDLSDGIAGDAEHIAAASGVALDIDLGRLPLAPAVRAVLAGRPDLWPVAAAGGDDYELLLTGPADLPAAVPDGLPPLTPVGTVTVGSGVRFTRDGSPVTGLAGWRHF